MSENEMMEYFRNMPKKESAANPYWKFQREDNNILTVKDDSVFSLENSRELLYTVREYFRRVYESFRTEAQVLCVTVEDAKKLDDIMIPRLNGTQRIGDVEVVVFVLPQTNTSVNSIIGENFWQKYIIGQGIVPVARIHSHHTFDAYQSATDYSSLNSNTLEIVMGFILDDRIHAAYWLDKHETDTKSYVFQVTEDVEHNFSVRRIRSGYQEFCSF